MKLLLLNDSLLVVGKDVGGMIPLHQMTYSAAMIDEELVNIAGNTNVLCITVLPPINPSKPLKPLSTPVSCLKIQLL